MQDNELFELCKEVYKRTGWDSTEKCYAFIDEFGEGGKHWRVIPLHEDNVDDVDDWYPLYTSDYLLEKLSGLVDYVSMSQNNKVTIDSEEGEKGKWYAHYWLKSRRLQVSSDTPLKSLLKLTIALSEAGELK